jgi:hypothetical protein
MPKKKRTRKDKIQADQRRQTFPLPDRSGSAATVTSETEATPKAENASMNTFSLPTAYTSSKKKTVEHTAATTKTSAIQTSTYSYLRGDLMKTLFLTGSIIAVELCVYFFMMK